MKKLLTLFAVLAIASMATALPVYISVDGVVNPPDSAIELAPSDHAVIDLHGVINILGGETLAGYMIVQGEGAIDATNAVVLQGDGTVTSFASTDEIDVGYTWAMLMADTWGYQGVVSNILLIDMLDSTVPYANLDGKIVDLIDFHCTGIGDATITFFNPETAEVFDSQVIHQIPEPMTIALLGLGGLFLRRRK